MAATALDKLKQHNKETALLEAASALLDWDERCYLPASGGEFRAEQSAYLAGMIHRRRVDPQIGDWLAELAAATAKEDPHGDAATVARELRHDYDKQVKLPASLVEELAKARSLGQQAWVEARKNNDFASFSPFLEKILHLRRSYADALGHNGCRYDALLDDYEPGATTEQVRAVLEALRQDLVPLVKAIVDGGRRPPELLSRHYPRAAQEKICHTVAERVGFEFKRGRIDVTHHPFCTTLGPDDCRITTRYDEHDIANAFFGTLHEAGHGLYEQGLRTEWFGLPPGSAASLGIHESQSRMWENFVGRGQDFWHHFFPEMQAAFPEALDGVRADELYFAVNDVHPSLIRTESDEATYNLHIIIRFEIEQALLAGDLPLIDLPATWNAKYQEYLGIVPPTDADGVLQDVHWSAALMGYFPTYSLGNMYAAQLFAQADKELGGLGDFFRRGEFSPLREWLREKVHVFGRCYRASDLVRKATGSGLDHRPLIAHLQRKLAPMYGV